MKYINYADIYTKIEEDYRVQTSNGGICKFIVLLIELLVTICNTKNLW